MLAARARPGCGIPDSCEVTFSPARLLLTTQRCSRDTVIEMSGPRAARKGGPQMRALFCAAVVLAFFVSGCEGGLEEPVRPAGPAGPIFSSPAGPVTFLALNHKEDEKAIEAVLNVGDRMRKLLIRPCQDSVLPLGVNAELTDCSGSFLFGVEVGDGWFRNLGPHADRVCSYAIKCVNFKCRFGGWGNPLCVACGGTRAACAIAAIACHFADCGNVTEGGKKEG